MTLSNRLLALLALAVLLATPSTSFGKDIEDRKWIEVRTPNFAIRSMLDEEATVKLARYLEMFRIVAAIVTGTPLIDSPLPTEIYTISSGRASKDFGLEPTVAGFFHSGLRRNTIVVRRATGVKSPEIMMHEYVHFLVRSHGNTNYPMWFQEGFAEYLSTAVIESGVVTIGNMSEHRAETFKFLSWVRMSRIVGREGGESWGPKRNAMFYAESWGLVHFLMNRNVPGAPFSQQLQRYVALMDAGTGSVEAFEEAFAISMHDLDKEVRRYLGGNRIPGLRFELDAVLTNFEPEVSVLTREQISLALGQYGLMTESLDKAEHWFTIAAGDERYEARAAAGLGDVQKFRGNHDEALPHFERALQLAPNDPYCQLDAAEYWHDRAESTDDEAQQAEFLGNAREHYLAAWKLDASLPETYAMYGKSFLVDGSDFDKAIDNLEEAQRLLPSSIEIRLSLAEAYLGAERPKDAAAAARSVLAWVHGESETAEEAQEILNDAES